MHFPISILGQVSVLSPGVGCPSGRRSTPDIKTNLSLSCEKVFDQGFCVRFQNMFTATLNGKVREEVKSMMMQ